MPLLASSASVVAKKQVKSSVRNSVKKRHGERVFPSSSPTDLSGIQDSFLSPPAKLVECASASPNSSRSVPWSPASCWSSCLTTAVCAHLNAHSAHSSCHGFEASCCLAPSPSRLHPLMEPLCRPARTRSALAGTQSSNHLYSFCASAMSHTSGLASVILVVVSAQNS